MIRREPARASPGHPRGRMFSRNSCQGPISAAQFIGRGLCRGAYFASSILLTVSSKWSPAFLQVPVAFTGLTALQISL